MSLSKLCALVGIFFTIAGTILVSWHDLLAPYAGQSHIITTPTGSGARQHKTLAYENWERKRRRTMGLGVVLILLGAALASAPTLLS